MHPRVRGQAAGPRSGAGSWRAVKGPGEFAMGTPARRHHFQPLWLAARTRSSCCGSVSRCLSHWATLEKLFAFRASKRKYRRNVCDVVSTRKQCRPPTFPLRCPSGVRPHPEGCAAPRFSLSHSGSESAAQKPVSVSLLHGLLLRPCRTDRNCVEVRFLECASSSPRIAKASDAPPTGELAQEFTLLCQTARFNLGMRTRAARWHRNAHSCAKTGLDAPVAAGHFLQQAQDFAFLCQDWPPSFDLARQRSDNHSRHARQVQVFQIGESHET
jgi:hypothetical protein